MDGRLQTNILRHEASAQGEIFWGYNRAESFKKETELQEFQVVSGECNPRIECSGYVSLRKRRGE